MTVQDLRKLVNEVPKHLTRKQFDAMQVIIPTSEEFDGYFVSPCLGESGVTELGINENSDETEESFVLAPHGFFEEQVEDDVIPELNQYLYLRFIILMK